MKRYKTLRKETSTLLQKGEGPTIDFKRTDKVDAEDLVAFANSPLGGTIFLGVKEEKDKNGRQVGVPCGVTLTDELALKLQNKASSCVPPIQATLYEENTSKTPIVRIDIPPSSNTPHCTGSGTYKIRGIVGNDPLLPSAVLDILLKRESQKFIERFSKSSDKLIKSVENIKNQVVPSISDLGDNLTGVMGMILNEVSDTQDSLSYKLKEIIELTDQTFSHADETKSNTEDIHDTVYNISHAVNSHERKFEELYDKIDSLLINDKADDYSLLNNQENGFYVAHLLLEEKKKEEIFFLFKERNPTLTKVVFEKIYKWAKKINEKIQTKQKKRNLTSDQNLKHR